MSRQRGQGVAGSGIPARERILVAFTERARVRGIRAVVMGDLARDLGLSKKTLYLHFESKDSMVREIIERWVKRARENLRSPEAPLHDAHELVRWWTDLWVKQQTDYCGEFWRDLEADHPEAWRIFQSLRDAGHHMQARVAQWFRPEIHRSVAAELYYLILGYFNDPLVCAKFGFHPHEAVLAAIEIWLGGALRPDARPDAALGLDPDPMTGGG